MVNVLIVGHGAREHVIGETLVKGGADLFSFMSFKNAGLEDLSKKIKISSETDFKEIIDFCKENNIDFAVIGPEAPLVVGIVNALSLIMSGVFNEDFPDLHFIWSLMIFISWIPFLFLLNTLLYQRQGVERWISFYGFGLAFYNIFFVSYVLLLGTTSGSILEWIAVFSFQAWAILIMIAISWRYRSASKNPEKT